jgi:hypothetical protein
LLPQRRGRRGAKRLGGEVEFLVGDDAAGPETAREQAQGVHRIGKVHQHQPANDGVEGAAQGDFAAVPSNEGEMVQTRRLGAGEGRGEDLRVGVHPDDAPARADELGGHKGDVAGSGADVQDPHALLQAGVLEHSPGGGVEDLGGEDQAPRLTLGAARHVNRVVVPARLLDDGHGCCLPAQEWVSSASWSRGKAARG